MVPKAIRDASVAADKKLSAFEVDLGMKKEVRPVFYYVTRFPIGRFFYFRGCIEGRDTTLELINMSKKWGGLGSNEFQLK